MVILSRFIAFTQPLKYSGRSLNATTRSFFIKNYAIDGKLYYFLLIPLNMYGLLLIILLILVPSVLFIWLMKKAETKLRIAIKVFVLGMEGWFLAFVVRLPVFQGIQIAILLNLGVDITNQAEIQMYATYLPLIIWGPILAGLFEGTFRYLFIKIPREVRTERQWLPGLFGLGWTFMEILLLVIVPIVSQNLLFNLSLFNMLISFIERVSASIVHIALSYVAMYGIFEESKKKYSVYIAIFLHMAFDGLIIYWIISFSRLSPEWYFLSLEAGLFAGSMATILWTFQVWVPRSERLIESRKEILEKEGILGEGVVRFPANKEDFSIDKF